MKIQNSEKILGLSLVAAMLLGSGAYGGKIITNAPEGTELKSATSTPNEQFGFGGWNFDNVDVRIVNIEDFTTPTLGSFDTQTGVYGGMGRDMSFESDLTTDNEIRGHLHGKNWPVGEPAGIKVINGDMDVKHGKPVNCIMTTSYLDTGFLDVTPTKPTLCSSDFQTHKRFKINMLPSMVANPDENGYGQPVEISFNLDPNDNSTENVRYQVFQKINNYTGKRLNGYKLEVLDANGNPNDALTLSLGIGEGVDKDGQPDGSNIWEADQLSNFSRGLWGPLDEQHGDDPHFVENGFFDSTRVYYPVILADNKQAISHVGNLAGGNYQTLFGNWLTSEWAPTGIFYDDDNDPATDAQLLAFWGDPEHTGTNAWHEGNEENWADATVKVNTVWNGGLYTQGKVEDVLNLGLFYIVNIGNNAAIGNKFTIRLTPHVDTDQDAPLYVSDPAPAEEYIESEGLVGIAMEEDFTETVVETTTLDAKTVISTNIEAMTKDSLIKVGVADSDLNIDPTVKDTVTVTVKSDHGETETVELSESGVDTARFIGTLEVKVSDDAMVDGDGKFNLNKHTNLKALYYDYRYGAEGVEKLLEADLAIDIDVAENPTEVPVQDPGSVPVQDPESVLVQDSGSGGGCTYNPNSKNFDMTFLLMIGLGLLYPFRRRLIK